MNVISLIGIILLIGIVKKNAIVMIDFAIRRERRKEKAGGGDLPGLSAALPSDHDDHHAALLGGLPLAMGTGLGSEMRRPLGIAIVGGLLFSQLLTVFTTPVIYLYLDRMGLRWAAWKARSRRIVPEASQA